MKKLTVALVVSVVIFVFVEERIMRSYLQVGVRKNSTDHQMRNHFYNAFLDKVITSEENGDNHMDRLSKTKYSNNGKDKHHFRKEMFDNYDIDTLNTTLKHLKSFLKMSEKILLKFNDYNYFGDTLLDQVKAKVHTSYNEHDSTTKDKNFDTQMLNKEDLSDPINSLQEKYPNIPISEWVYYETNSAPQINSKCAVYPKLYNVNFINKIWQVETINITSVYLFGAYYDNRESNNSSYVRIISMWPSYTLKGEKSAYCQLWFKEAKKPQVVKAKGFDEMWISQWGVDKDFGLYPYLISCPIPKQYENENLQSISVVEAECSNARNNLRVINGNSNKQINKTRNGIGVCAKAISFLAQDKSINLIEWIEALVLLGARKVHMYEYESHPDTHKVIKYYMNKGLLSIDPLTFAKNIPAIPGLINKYMKKKTIARRYNEVIAYNDCFLKNMYDYEYILFVDTDEIIVGNNGENWNQLLSLNNNSGDGLRLSYCALNVYFTKNKQNYTDIPPYMSLLQETERAKNTTGTGNYVKCFHNTYTSLILHNHFSFKCIKYCKYKTFDKSVALLHHHRGSCHSEIRDCAKKYLNNTIIDESLLKIKIPLIKGVKTVINHLELKPKT